MRPSLASSRVSMTYDYDVDVFHFFFTLKADLRLFVIYPMYCNIAVGKRSVLHAIFGLPAICHHKSFTVQRSIPSARLNPRRERVAVHHLLAPFPPLPAPSVASPTHSPTDGTFAGRRASNLVSVVDRLTGRQNNLVMQTDNVSHTDRDTDRQADRHADMNFELADS